MATIIWAIPSLTSTALPATALGQYLTHWDSAALVKT